MIFSNPAECDVYTWNEPNLQGYKNKLIKRSPITSHLQSKPIRGQNCNISKTAFLMVLDDAFT